jgi:hypothetical protein
LSGLVRLSDDHPTKAVARRLDCGRRVEKGVDQ